ncbi:MAG: cytochrome c oxidase subunit II [SAR202 cluster bacterium Io17-Chloro-G7]|nr:MAG: cytochrome c oxidase subunit II [SAR202 cluster bacterium Io17-Chloro-G7]
MGSMPFKRASAPVGVDSPNDPIVQPMRETTSAAPRRWQPKAILLFGLLIAVLFLVAGCSTGKQSTWDAVGPVAEKQLLLFNVLLWVMVVVFVLVEGLMLYVIFRFRKKPGVEASRTHGHLALEITWTVIPTILVLALGIWSVFTLFEIDEPPDSETDVLEVHVTGHQWWFEFEYPDAGGGKRITTANELRIPVDRAVQLTLLSDDVIHSFWVPKLAGKLDMVPTRRNKMWFKADSSEIDALPATFYGQCAELCGVAHALMRFRVMVLSAADYDSWVASYGPPQPLTSRAKDGQTTFAINCQICHTISGADDPVAAQALMDSFLTGDENALVLAPNLTDLRTRQTLAAGLTDLNVETLRAWIHNPSDLKPGNRMAERAFIYKDGDVSLSDEEVEGLIEYLLQLQ